MTDPIEIGPPYLQVTIEIVADADWNDALPPLLLDGVALDLTGKVLELYIRPAYDHTLLIKKLTSIGSAGIVIDDAAGGLASLYVERPIVIAELPVGTWDQFLVLRDTTAAPGDVDGFLFKEIWRGPLIVHPGRT